MRKATKSALIIFLILVVTVIPLYYYTRPDPNQSADSLQLIGKLDKPQTLSLAEIKSLPSITIQVTLTSSSRREDNGVFNYTGVRLNDLLERAKASPNAKTVFVQASDGYGSTLSMHEANNPKTIIAYQKDSEVLTSLKDGGEGPLRLIIGNDPYAQRWVRGVVAIDVR